MAARSGGVGRRGGVVQGAAQLLVGGLEDARRAPRSGAPRAPRRPRSPRRRRHPGAHALGLGGTVSGSSGPGRSGSSVMVRGYPRGRARRRSGPPARRPRRGAPRRRRDDPPPVVDGAVAADHQTGRPRPSPGQPPRHQPAVVGSGAACATAAGRPGRARRTSAAPSSGAATSSASPVTPVSTSSESSPLGARPRCRCPAGRPPSAAAAPPTRRTVSSSSGRSGLPATTGSTPVKPRSISTRTPCPGATPYAVGIVWSVLLATHGSPSRIRTAARMIARHRTSGP